MKIVIAADKNQISTEELDAFLLAIKAVDHSVIGLWKILSNVKPTKKGGALLYKISPKHPYFEVYLFKRSSKYVVTVAFFPGGKIAEIYNVAVGWPALSYSSERASVEAAGKAAGSMWNKLTSNVWDATRKIDSMWESIHRDVNLSISGK